MKYFEHSFVINVARPKYWSLIGSDIHFDAS